MSRLGWAVGLWALAGCGSPLLPPPSSGQVGLDGGAADGGAAEDAGPPRALSDLQVTDASGARVALDTGAIDLGAQQVLGDAPATQTVTLTNAGAWPLALAPGDVTVVGLAAADYTLQVSALSLAPGGSETFSISFAPTSVGARPATLLMATPMGRYDVALRGVGTAQHVFVAVGANGRRAWSADGLTWTESVHDDRNRVAPTDCPDAAHQLAGPHGGLLCRPTVVTDVSSFSAVCYGNGRYIATAASGCANITDPDGTTHGTCGVPGFTYLSVDGKVWRRVSDAGGNSCAYGNGTFVIAVDNAPLLSTDGLKWFQGGEFDASGPKNQYGGLAAGFRRVVFDGQRFVATGTLDAVATSSDGRTWSATTQRPGLDSASTLLAGARGWAVLSHPKVVQVGEAWVDGRTCKAQGTCAAGDTSCIEAAYVLARYPTETHGCSCAWNDDALGCFEVSTSTADNTWSAEALWTGLFGASPPAHTFHSAAAAGGQVYLFGPDQNAVLDEGAATWRFVPRTFSYTNPEGVVAGPVGPDGKRMLVGTGWQAEIYSSADEGQTWVRFDMAHHPELDNESWSGFVYGSDAP